MQTNSKSIDGVKRVIPAKAHPVHRAQRAPAPVQKRNSSFNFASPAFARSADAVYAVPKTPVNKKLFFNLPSIKFPRINLNLHFNFNIKNFAKYSFIIVVTFFVSLATSQGIAKINNQEPNVTQAVTYASPRSAELAVTNQPDNPTLYGNVLAEPGYVHLASENLTLPDPLEKRKEFLQDYLKARGSVLADHVDALSEQSQWKLIVAISRAESSFCKRHKLNNCWGIGGAWNLRSYASYEEAVADVNRLLEQKYIAQGLDTPSKMVRKWVGHQSDTWEAAVEQELENLKDVE